MSLCRLAVSAAVILALAPALAAQDAAKARKQLDDAYVEFTPANFVASTHDPKRLSLFLEAGMPVDSVDAQGRTALHAVAGEDDSKVVPVLLKAGAKVNIPDKYGKTALCVAVDHKAARNVGAFLKAGGDPSGMCDRDSVLHLAVGHDDVATVTQLLAAGAALEARNRFGQTPLIVGAHFGATASVTALLGAGAEVDARDNNGTTALHEAAQGRYPALVTALLQAGATVDQRDAGKRTPLYWAAKVGAVETIPLLLAAGADPADKGSGQTALEAARAAAQTAAVDLLRDAHKVTPPPRPAAAARPAAPASPVDPAQQLKQMGLTANAETLIQRVEVADLKAVELLLKAGVPPDVKDRSGRPPLWNAVERRQTELVKVLIAGGASAKDAGLAANPQLEFGTTLVTLAVQSNDLEILQAVIKAGGEVRKTDRAGFTPLMVAAQAGRTDMAALLIASGADLSAREPQAGMTALHLAVYGGQTEVVRLLLKAGSRVGKDRAALLESAGNPEVKKLIQAAP